VAKHSSLRQHIACIAIAGSCSSAGKEYRAKASPPESQPSSTRVVIRTDSIEYHPVIGNQEIILNVVASLTNNTPDTLTLHPCYQQPPYPLSVGLDRLQGNEWHSALVPICTTALMLDPPTVLPGATRIDTLHLRGSTRPNTLPAFAAGPLEGFYRLHYYSVYRKWYPRNPPIGSRDRLGEQVSEPERVSNVFRVTD
jgi:hypothetical protein